MLELINLKNDKLISLTSVSIKLRLKLWLGVAVAQLMMRGAVRGSLSQLSHYSSTVSFSFKLEYALRLIKKTSLRHFCFLRKTQRINIYYHPFKKDDKRMLVIVAGDLGLILFCKKKFKIIFEKTR